MRASFGPTALAVVLLVGCTKSVTSSTPTDRVMSPVPVTVAALRFAPIGSPIELSGSLAAVQSSTLGAMSAGRVVRVNVRIGDIVHAGDVIAQIDTSGSAAALAQARAGASAAAASASATRWAIDVAAAAIGSARAQLDAARAREALSSTTAARMAQLFAQGAISQQQRDQTQTDLAAAHAAVAQAQAGVAGAEKNLTAASAQARASADSATQARAGVEAANVPLRDATLTAPFGGTVVNKFVEPGAVVAVGSPVVAIENAHDLEVDVAVPDDALAAVAPGMRIDVRVDAVGGAPISARIRAIVPSQNPALRSATLKMTVPSRPGFAPGMFVRVTLPGRRHLGWVAPLAALVTRAGQSGVFVVRNDTALFIPLQPGTVDAAGVELLGIDGRATVVAVSGVERLDDRSRVTVRR